MTVYFTSDTHFLHENICKYCNRPFSSLKEMEEHLVDSWNSRVNGGDIIYHLGDFSLSYGKKSTKDIDKILSRLNGQKFLIIGNHDRKEVYDNARWTKTFYYHEIKACVGEKINRKIVLSHYSFRTWNQMHYGSYMLFGHSHNTLTDIEGRSMDVGVDACNYAPISLCEVVDKLERIEFKKVDHHEQEG